MVNAGARYNDAARRMVNNRKAGDIFYFDDVKARCPGDNVGARSTLWYSRSSKMDRTALQPAETATVAAIAG